MGSSNCARSPSSADECRLKTRATCAWLERRDFHTRLVERRFDGNFRCHETEPRKEPGLALCGFDSNAARRDLATAQFLRVVESGLGGTATNFDTISFHTLPNPRSADQLWPNLSKEEEKEHAENQARLARENPGYAQLGKDECGRYDLAGKSVAVAFVGVIAGSFVVAEVLRLAHGGPAFAQIKLSPELRICVMHLSAETTRLKRWQD